MAQIRTAAARIRGRRGRPAVVVERVNALIHDLGPPTMTTLAYVVLDPERESFEVVIAGHPPPLMIPRDGAASFLPLQGGIPLGASPIARYRSDTHALRAGETIVLYTDGLVETRAASIDEGLERLRAAATAALGPEALCARLVDAHGARRARATTSSSSRAGPAAARAPARPLAGRGARARRPCGRLLRRWLRAQGATDDETADITVACQEACTNAIEHAYRPRRAVFDRGGDLHDGPVRITVCDDGSLAAAPRRQPRARAPLMRAADALAWTSGTPTRAPSSCSSARSRGAAA